MIGRLRVAVKRTKTKRQRRRIRRLRREMRSYGYEPRQRQLGEPLSAYEFSLGNAVWELRRSGVIKEPEGGRIGG